MKNISKKDINLIAVFDGVLYEYHDGSWHEKESWNTDDELSNELENIPKVIITPSQLPRVTPGNEVLIQRLILIPFSEKNEE